MMFEPRSWEPKIFYHPARQFIRRIEPGISHEQLRDNLVAFFRNNCFATEKVACCAADQWIYDWTIEGSSYAKLPLNLEICVGGLASLIRDVIRDERWFMDPEHRDNRSYAAPEFDVPGMEDRVA